MPFLGEERRQEGVELFSPGRRSCCCSGGKLCPLPSFGARAREEPPASLGAPGSPMQGSEHGSTLAARITAGFSSGLLNAP